MKVNPETRCVH